MESISPILPSDRESEIAYWHRILDLPLEAQSAPALHIKAVERLLELAAIDSHGAAKIRCEAELQLICAIDAAEPVDADML